jgi:hypothetical protein
MKSNYFTAQIAQAKSALLLTKATGNKRFGNMVAGHWNFICVLLSAAVPADEYL